MVTIVALTSAAIGMVKGVYQVSIRSGHWLCFGTTLTVTAVAAWIGSSYFSDVRILWVAALLTGLVSALATEGIRRSIIALFSNNRTARAVALIPLGRQLRPGGRLFWRITTGIGDWFIGLLAMHPQNA